MAKKYDYKKTAKKFVTGAVAVILAGLAAKYGDNQAYLVLAPLIAAVANILKHKYNIDVKIV